MSKGYLSVHCQGYEGPKTRYEDKGFMTAPWKRLCVAYSEPPQSAPHIEAPNVLPIGPICSARLS